SNASASRVLPKNAHENRSDIVWKHEIAVDGTRKIQCKYCQKVVSGRSYRFKHHLAETNKDVEPCIIVSDELKKKMLLILVKKRKEIENLFKRKGINTQVTINNMFKKIIKEEENQVIARFFYHNVARSDKYFEMFDLIAKHDPGFKPPSYHEIRVKYYLKEEINLLMHHTLQKLLIRSLR
ncbi:hypothetical protein Lal_00008585, partial [Lupinus albus]